MSSPARTGTCVRDMSSRMAKRCGEVSSTRREVPVVGLPGGGVPELQAVAGADDGDVPIDAHPLGQLGAEHHAARRVQLDRMGVGAEEAVQFARLARERVETREGCVHERRIGPGGIERETPVGPLDEEGPLGERGTELRRDRQPVLGVEGVIEGAVEGQCSYPALRRGSVDPRWRSGRSPATPDRLRESKVPHFLPLCNTVVVIRPTFPEPGCLLDRKSPQIGGVLRWGAGRSPGSSARRSTCTAASCRGSCAEERGAPTLRGMPRAVLLALVFVALLVAGCGGGSASGGHDPASAVPRDAAIYLDATVRPDGSLRDDALAAAGKILGTREPEARIDELIAKALAEAEDPKLDYARDAEPWLGEKVALWATATGGEDFRGAVIVPATDTDAARATIDRIARDSGKATAERSYEGVDYRFDADEGDAAGIVEDFAVFGTEAEFKRTVDAAKGDGLDGDGRFREAIDPLED